MTDHLEWAKQFVHDCIVAEKKYDDRVKELVTKLQEVEQDSAEPDYTVVSYSVPELMEWRARTLAKVDKTYSELMEGAEHCDLTEYEQSIWNTLQGIGWLLGHKTSKGF